MLLPCKLEESMDVCDTASCFFFFGECSAGWLHDSYLSLATFLLIKFLLVPNARELAHFVRSRICLLIVSYR